MTGSDKPYKLTYINTGMGIQIKATDKKRLLTKG